MAPVRPQPGVAGRGLVPGGTPLSRTDAHAPLWVRLARGELAVEAHHAADHDCCDLPARPPGVRPSWSADTKCHWAFRYAGTNICSCWMCHAGWESRRLNRSNRRHDRAGLRVTLDRWRCGDVFAFDDIAPMDRSRFW